jgi:hypothetical protein
MAIGQLGKRNVVYDADTAGLEPGLLDETMICVLRWRLRFHEWSLGWAVVEFCSCCFGRLAEPQ